MTEKTPFETLLIDVIGDHVATLQILPNWIAKDIIAAMKKRRIVAIATDDVIRFKVMYGPEYDPRAAVADFAGKLRDFILENNMVKVVPNAEQAGFVMFDDLLLPGYPKAQLTQQGQA